MNRLKQAWLALFTHKPEPEPDAAKDEPTGVLFGLDPPEGCKFEVSWHVGGSWHVRIMRGEQRLAHECAIYQSEGKDDEKLIVLAARRALASCARSEVVKDLEGCYPPKVAKGKRSGK